MTSDMDPKHDKKMDETFGKHVLRKLAKKEHLTFQETEKVILNLKDGNCTDTFSAAFLMSLILNGENEEELSAIIDVIRSSSNRITPQTSVPLVDNCGTGGDMLNTFNISTAAALVAGSSKKIAVAKHGNKSSSGVSGSADFFERIGYPIQDNKVDTHVKSIEKHGLGFLYAPVFHPSLKSVIKLRKELGIRTVFNTAGPLCNPCTNLHSQVIGLSNPNDLDLIPKLIPILGLNRALIIRSQDGMDELSITSTNTVKYVFLEDGRYNTRTEILDPVSLGLTKCSISDIAVKNKNDSINQTLRVVYGCLPNSPKENMVLLNSAATIVAGNGEISFEDALSESLDCIRNGRPQLLLRNLIEDVGDISKLEIAEKTLDL
ncbi:anthranilate phosphoribosyltransferase [Candidatus Nitrosocosmicus sp. SS]|jgi:anthranilate phosphoribosyltransferase|uniref:anthranilate phosphoribosyltransferase n=2 Tax=Candidatus Nitrosocosmicus agrestis TaxID=2563600 RepID=UPI00122E1B6C|nr:anthranilate phosphoribosyltransferase [Candidatus Nitrosocosmicus sp. SS]KAA2280796.1 anthranilate phosphoribosyltransferase [Candidatus Nitrosocosmicus sp. SS]KAF0868881.1 anthranilate phosphoribosyltransferase [Candidatus Nitrosocosmicus sp. SS]MDR4492147.1 anthranilate phosphoribosyltransferase [Candidatus Nitrosocosmicus sp.]